jgi:hypothetical protein
MPTPVLFLKTVQTSWFDGVLPLWLQTVAKTVMGGWQGLARLPLILFY